VKSVTSGATPAPRGRDLNPRRIVGRDHILRIRPESLDTVERWLARKTAFWRAQLEVLDELLRTAHKRKQRT
jgi:hypothetical protein